MNRREAIATLMAMPAVKRIAHMDALTPDDCIVIETEQVLSRDERARIGDSLSQVWPGRRIVVLDGGMTLKIANVPKAALDGEAR